MVEPDDLNAIKWLLVAILVGVSIIVVSFAVLASVSILSFRLLKENKRGSLGSPVVSLPPPQTPPHSDPPY